MTDGMFAVFVLIGMAVVGLLCIQWMLNSKKR